MVGSGGHPLDAGSNPALSIMNIAKPEQRELEEIDNKDRYNAEIKYDGTRMLVFSDGNEIKLINKRGNDKTDLYPEFEDLDLPENTILDGEIVVFDEQHPHGNFRKMMRRDSGNWCFKKKLLYKKQKATFVAFDVIEWKGESYRSVPLRERRNKLEEICEGLHPHIEVADVYSDISDVWATTVRQKNMEGLVIKDKDSEYPEGRTKKWLKIKNTKDLVRKVHNIEEHSKGIRVETKEEGQGLTINGKKAERVKQMIREDGEAKIEVTCLEKNGDSLRQPVFKRIAES